MNKPDVLHEHHVTAQEQGMRLDAWLALHYALSRHTAARLIADKCVRVGTTLGAKGTKLRTGDQITLRETPQDPVQTPPIPQPELPLEVLYLDGDVIAVNKPVGVHVHPLRAGERGTVASALMARYPECAVAAGQVREGGFCHRLDQGTSGVLLAARHRRAWNALHQAFVQEHIRKEYVALCVGDPASPHGDIGFPLVPTPGRTDHMTAAVAPDEQYHPRALSARTRYEIIASHAPYHLVRVWPHTGRRHQIRAHLSAVGLPLYGDTLYGEAALQKEGLAGKEGEGPWLHAYRLIIPELPALQRKESITIEAPLPEQRRHIAEQLLGRKDLLALLEAV